MDYVHRTFFAQSGGLETTGLRETKIDPTAIPAVRSFSRRSPQILAILSAQLSERELCRGVKWRRKRAWQPTLSGPKPLFLLGMEIRRVRIPRRDPMRHRTSRCPIQRGCGLSAPASSRPFASSPSNWRERALGRAALHQNSVQRLA